MWRTIPVALLCWLILVVSSRGQDVFVPRELKSKPTTKSDKEPTGQALSEKESALAKEHAAAPPAHLRPEKVQSDQAETAKVNSVKAPSVNQHGDKNQAMKFEPVRPLAGKEPPLSLHAEKTQTTKIEPVRPLTGKEAHPENVQSAKTEPVKAPAVKERTTNPRNEKIQSAKAEPEKPALKETTGNSRSEKIQSAKVEPDKLPVAKERETKARSGKIQAAKAEPEKASGVKESAENPQKAQSVKADSAKAAATKGTAANPSSEKVQSAKVELPKAPTGKASGASSRSEKVQLAKTEPVKGPEVKEPVVNLQPEKTSANKADSAKAATAPEPTVDVQLSDRSTETASTKLADGFDFPVGKPEAEGYYKARGFRSGGHMGEDWDGVRGGDTDLKDPIYCIGNGIVVFARDVHRGWGNVVIVRHTFRESGAIKHVDSLYGHLNSILVKRGQKVARGQQIGTMGTAHGQYDAHLHLEIRKNLEIGMSRAKFAKNFSNYYDPSQFIESHRRLSGGGATFRVAMNTFTHDAAFHFDDAPNYSARKHSTAQSAAALKQALSGTR